MKHIYIILGLISLGLGVVGAILPLLPATPFLIFTAFCFTKSSKRLDAWFKGTKIYKNNIESFVKKEGLTVAAKRRILISITVVMLIAAFFMRNTHIGLICLSIVWLAHMVGFIFFVKNKEDTPVQDV